MQGREKLRGTPVLCFHGSEEKDSLCPSCPPGLVNDITVEGGHRVHGRFEPIATAILKAAQ